MADGNESAHRRGPAVAKSSAPRPRDRPLPAHARRAPRRRSATSRSSMTQTRAALDAYAAGVNAFLATGPVAAARIPGVRRRARAVDARRFRGLAQDDGLGPRRQLAHRNRCACGSRSGSARSSIAEFLPPYPGEPPLPVRDLTALYRSLAPAAATDRRGGAAVAAGRRGLEQLGGRRRAQRRRQAAARQRSASRAHRAARSGTSRISPRRAST